MAPQVALKNVTEAAAEADILREQLDYLIDHVDRHPQCGCSECQRYQWARAALLAIFTKPTRANVEGRVEEMVPRLAKAA